MIATENIISIYELKNKPITHITTLLNVDGQISHTKMKILLV